MKQLNAIAHFCKQEKEIICLNLDEIELYGGTQQRVRGLDFAHVESLTEALAEKKDLNDPVEIVSDGETNWLVDGFHRYYAYKNNHRLVIPCHITEGNLRDAILASVSANSQHLALPRKPADRRKAIITMLNDPEWAKWSDHAIAKQAGSTHPTVAKIRNEQLVNLPDRKFIRHGNVIEMNTQNIGRSVSQKADINDFTARDGHVVPKPKLGETEGQSNESPRFAPEIPSLLDREAIEEMEDAERVNPKPIDNDLKDWFLGFMSRFYEFPNSYILAIEQKLKERKEMEAMKL